MSVINENTIITGIFNGTVNDLLRPFKDSKEFSRAKRLAPMYLKFGRLFKIRADLAFAQMCHETGLLRYTGIAKPDWNNFCGLGVTGPGAVQKFLIEDYGVIAHYAHLAWYVYPNHINSMCSKKFDPRHFGNVEKPHPKYNGEATLKRLNGSWAVPGLTYAARIADYANIINGDKDEPAPEPKPEPILQKGDRGKEVIKLQKYLSSIGFSLVPDGIFGPKTKARVKQYQKNKGLKVTGFVDEITKKKMNDFVIVESEKLDIIVQMGHVGRTKGATGAYREKEWTEKLGKAMELLLIGSNLRYRIMGADDWLKPEPNLCTIFLALHYDGSRNKNARGYSLGFKLGSNPDFKEALALSYGRLCGFTRRRDNYTVGLRKYYGWRDDLKRKPHVEAQWYALLEHGFGSNDIEREWMFDNIENIAEHHIEVIKRFLKDVKK